MDHYSLVCECLCALESWKYEDKSRLLHTIVNWSNQSESLLRIQCEKNIRYLLELLMDDIVIVPLLPVESILEIIESVDIPSEEWRNYLTTYLLSQTDDNHQFVSHFDSTANTTMSLPLTTNFNSISSEDRFHWDNQQNSLGNRSYIDDISRMQDFLSFEPALTIPQTMIHSRYDEEPLDEYQTILNENLSELFQLKWDRSAVESLKNVFNSSQVKEKISSLKTALLVVETIVTNRISLPLHVQRIVKTIETRSVHKWMDDLNEIIDEQDKTKTVSMLLEELADKNPSLDIIDLREQYQTVMDYYKAETSRWTSTDIQNQQSVDNKFFRIAVIIRAAQLHKQYRPRDIQILSLLLLIDGKRRGRLAQIRTGEGKSLIVSMLAAYLSLPPLSKCVDIITTSDILAERDVREFAPFYEMFNLSVGHNCHGPSEKPNYNVNIVYGTVCHFAGDLLRTEFYLRTDVRGGRPYEAAIVDEVDSMFIDQRQHYTQLAMLTPGYKSMNVVLKFIFSFFQKFNITEENEFVIRQADGYYKVDAMSFIREKLSHDELLRFPQYRKDYIMAKLPKWIRGARRALYELTLDVHYVISSDKRIIVVDYANTGVSQLNMHWSDGVHQFLELKHNLRMTPERMCDSFFSNVTLFKRYRPCLFGVTGTLGGDDAQNFIRTVYEIDTIIVPKYIDSVFDIYPSQLGRDRAEWLERISIECRMVANDDHRAVLVICETIRDAEGVRSSLRSYDINPKKYLRSDLSDHIKPEEVHIGDVIVSTNLAGRGTDLKTMTDLNDRGGLHVVVAFMPRNSRIEEQAFGRAGRQGQPGSARLIVCIAHFGISSSLAIDEFEIINTWKSSRDKREKDEMAESVTVVERVEAKDRLLGRFLDLAHSRKVDLPFTNDIFKPGFSSLRELWASFCDEAEVTTEQRFTSFASNISQRLDVSVNILKQSLSSEDERIPRQFEAIRQLITHPKYLIHAGYNAMCMRSLSDHKNHALAFYQQAIQLDRHDFIAHYNMVPCYIENDQGSVNQAIQILEESIRLLDKEIETRRCIEIFHYPSTPDDGNAQTNGPVDQTSLAELIYLQIAHSTFKNNVESLKQFNKKKHDISYCLESWSESLDCLRGTKFEPLTNDIHAEREEWFAEGLIWRYVFVIKTKRCWWKTVFVFVMGVAQIIGGAYLCLQGHVRLGTSLILDGALDVYRAVATKITADFDMANYFETKIIKYGKELLSINGPLSDALKPIMSLKEINMIGVAIDAVREIANNGFSVETLTKVVLSGMNVAGVDQKTIDLVRQLSERVKDAQALFSGDIDKILDRGEAAGLPIDALRQIAKHGFTVETITQLTLEGMAKMGVDQKTIDLVKQLPDRIKDAQALLSGDLDKILDRAVVAGLPVDAVRRIVKNGFTIETVTQLAVDGMTRAGVDQNTIKLFQKLPDRIKDAQAILSGDINRILERGILAGLPLNTIKQITTHGFTVETVTQLARDGMNAAGVDKKTIDLLNQLPERIKDAKALASGDLNQILDRGSAAGLPVNTIREIIRNGFTPENAIQLAVEGMTIAKVDASKIDSVKLLPERIKDAQALLSGDFDRILERGLSLGLPVNTIREIVKHGFNVDTATQLAIEGMTIANVDANKIDLVRHLPERVKDVQALVSGDIDQIAKRGMLAGIPVEAIRQVATQKASVESITEIALAGMNVAGVNQNTIDFVKTLPETIKMTQAALKGDLEEILQRGMPAGIDRVLHMFNENSFFNGKEKEILDLIRSQMLTVQHIIEGESKKVLKGALKTIGEHIDNLPINRILPIVIQTAIDRVFESEQKDIANLYKKTIEQLSSTSEGLNQETCDIINNILKSSDKWTNFEQKKYQLDVRIQQMLKLYIERERDFLQNVTKVNNRSEALNGFCQALADLKITFATIPKRRVDVQKIINQCEQHWGSLLTRAMEDFFNEVSQNLKGTRSPIMMQLLKEYVDETVIESTAQKQCEQQMDKNDAELVNQFAKAIAHIQKQRR